MTRNLYWVLAITAILSLPARAHECNPGRTEDGQITSRGLKAQIALGGVNSSDTQNLKAGGMSALRLGYGFDDRFTLWGSLVGTDREWNKHDIRHNRNAATAGAELSLQYSIPTSSPLRPYGSIGVGSYALQDMKSHDAWAGSGVIFAVGADYFFAKHCGVGGVWSYRGMDYTVGKVGSHGDFDELDKPVDGDASGFAVTFTVR